jgi:hypothetical protein
MLPGQECARSQIVHSSTALCEIDRSWHNRSRVTALEIHGARDEAMAARATHEMRVYVECARSPLMLSITAYAFKRMGAQSLVSRLKHIVRFDLDSARAIAALVRSSTLTRT